MSVKIEMWSVHAALQGGTIPHYTVGGGRYSPTASNYLPCQSCVV